MSEPKRLRRRAAYLSLLLVALLLGVSATWHVVHQQGLATRQAQALERESQFTQQLNQFVKLQFGRPTGLKRWLDEWTRQTGIPVEVRHPAEFTSQEVGHSEVLLELPEVPARRALDTLSERYGATWEQQEHERIILHWYRRHAPELQHEIVKFPAPDFLALSYPT